MVGFADVGAAVVGAAVVGAAVVGAAVVGARVVGKTVGLIVVGATDGAGVTMGSGIFLTGSILVVRIVNDNVVCGLFFRVVAGEPLNCVILVLVCFLLSN